MSDSDTEDETTSSRSQQEEQVDDDDHDEDSDNDDDSGDDEEEEEEEEEQSNDGEESSTDDEEEEEEVKSTPPPSTKTKSKPKESTANAPKKQSNSTNSRSSSQKPKTPSKSPKSNANDDSKSKAPSKTASSNKPKRTWIEMVCEAIVALKDRTGSSQPAIQKYILATYPEVSPQILKQRLLLTLRSGVANQRLVKLRASYKLHPNFLKQRKKKPVKKTAVKKTAVKKTAVKKSVPVAPPKKKLTAAQIAALKEKERLEAIRKARLERIKKRRFPMDDLALIKEDKELCVSVSLPSRPTLPLVFEPYAPAASKSDTTGSGLWEDLIHVYHFFRGDVGWGMLLEQQKKQYVVAPFTLKQFVHAIQQVIVGNAKRSRMVPPLLTHLFVVALQYLCKDIPKLSIGLSPTSWSEILLLYMDAMERYATTEASVGPNVLQGLYIDTDYLLGTRSEPLDNGNGDTTSESTEPLYLQGLLSKAHSKLLTQDPWLLSAEELLILLRALVDDLLGSLPECQDDFDARQVELTELAKKKRIADAHLRKLQNALQKEKAQKEKKEKGENSNKKESSDSDNEDEDETEKDDNDDNDSNEDEGDNDKESSPPAGQRKSGGGGGSGKKSGSVTPQQLENAKKAQQKATDAYEKACRNRLLRTEAIGQDRNFHAAYNFYNDPEVIYVQQRGQMIKLPQSITWTIPIDLRTNKTSWHVIDKKSTLNAYLDSLDVRGKREAGLHAALVPLRKYLFDDIKELADKKALLKEKEELHRRLENAKLKCEFGRKSGRLAGKAEEEFGALQSEIDYLQKTIDGEAETEPVDWEFSSGLEMLRKFDSQDIYQQAQARPGRRTTRRDVQKQQQILSKAKEDEAVISKMACSKLWPTGNIDGSGAVGMIVSNLLDLEEACQALADWEGVDRKAWTASLETLVHTWYSASPPVVELEPCPSNSINGTKNGTTESTPDKTTSGTPDPKRRRVDGTATSIFNISTPSISHFLSTLKPPLLDLEERVFEISGLAMAARDADDADNNMSTNGEDQEENEQEQLQMAWKKLIHRLTRLPAKSHVKIRQIVVEAIAAARKAQLATIVAELRSALLLFHPAAAGSCKAAALELLERHGGYEDGDEEEMEEDDENGGIGEEEENSATTNGNNGQLETGINSVLCAEAVILNSSLDGHEDASRSDWIDAVKRAKTISKIAALTAAFVQKAKEKLDKLASEYETLTLSLEAWEKAANKRKKGGPSPKSMPQSDTSEVWAHVEFTDDFCMAKVENFPWWPAKMCKPKDEKLAASLAALDRSLVSLVGESGGIRVVKTEDLTEYSEDLPDLKDLSNHSKDLRIQLEQCRTMARRIVRSKIKKAAKAAASTKRKRSRSTTPTPPSASDNDFKEEKKLST